MTDREIVIRMLAAFVLSSFISIVMCIGIIKYNQGSVKPYQTQALREYGYTAHVEFLFFEPYWIEVINGGSERNPPRSFSDDRKYKGMTKLVHYYDNIDSLFLFWKTIGTCLIYGDGRKLLDASSCGLAYYQGEV